MTNTTIRTPACPICASTAPTKLIRQEPATEDARRVSLRGMLVDVVRCADCGAVFVERNFPESVLSEFYAELPGYIPVTMDNFGWWLQSTEYAIHQTFARLGNERPGPLLDVGCGRGTLVHLARRYGWDPTGLEVNKELARFVREELHVPCVEGYADSTELPRSHFKAVVLFDVIEHLYSPVDVLWRCRELLAPGGVVVVKTPNWRMQYIKESLRHALGRGTGNIATIGHINQFDSRSLANAFAAAGLTTLGVYPSQTFLPAIRNCEFKLSRTADYVAKQTFNLSTKAVHAVTGINLSFNLLAIARKG